MAGTVFSTRPDTLYGASFAAVSVDHPLAQARRLKWDALAGHPAMQGRGDVPFAYNRKEAKDHGEGGTLIGAPLAGRKVLIVDDVITAGTAIREVMQIIDAQGARAAGVLIALNRQERGKGELSAIQEVERDFGIPVVSIVSLTQVLEFLADDPQRQELVALQPQDRAQPLDVLRREEAVAAGRAPRREQLLLLQVPDLRDRDVGELVLE